MSSSSGFSPVVLIVDDDSDTRSVIRQSITAIGCDIVEAEDGIVAQQTCKKSLPDLIILDVMMPRMTGMEFLQWFRAAIPEPFVPVLMLTALGDIQQKVQGLSSGADDYLVKPFNYRELQARVQALLRIKDLTNELFGRTAELMATNARLTEMQQTLVRKERELVAAQMAGAAAHNIGQPLTTSLLHCRILDKHLQLLLNTVEDDQIPTIRQALETLASLRGECDMIQKILSKLQTADPHHVSEYLPGKKIVDIDSA